MTTMTEREKAFREVMEYLSQFDCNCNSIEHKGGHHLTCPKAIVGSIDCWIGFEDGTLDKSLDPRKSKVKDNP